MDNFSKLWQIWVTWPSDHAAQNLIKLIFKIKFINIYVVAAVNGGENHTECPE